jgi:hypothetical protein
VFSCCPEKSEAHPKVALPATIKDAMEILPEQLPPTFEVQTGNGAHAWWLFREPLIFETDEERRDRAESAGYDRVQRADRMDDDSC